MLKILMLSGYMTGPRLCGYMHRRQVNTRKHKTELAYIGRAPSKNVAFDSFRVNMEKGADQVNLNRPPCAVNSINKK
jgi:hypothetical protein